ncbi:MAG: response regulator [Limimaricola sp.]|uniref:response regulator n=1 Tax=Limimaricola sp. TaxID=2211665 RepID=UPI001DBA6175|nr:response regulator [Limimaricola sp.]MBI1417459.1 response regulator [Limimaricola sp.]
MRILAVDDEELVISLLKVVLPKLGYDQADFASSGEEALSLIQRSKTPYDCVLSDIRMPGMDGVELCGHIRGLTDYVETPIIMLTSMVDREYVDRSFGAGATDYMNKPIRSEELDARLRVAQMQRREVRRLSAGALAGTEPAFALEDAITLNDVPGFISEIALLNYLVQMSRINAFMHAAIGFQIEGVEAHYHRSRADDFKYMLECVAESIFGATRTVGVMISYLGSGSFVAIVPRVNSFDQDSLNDVVEMELDGLKIVDHVGKWRPVNVWSGPQINSRMFGGNPAELILRAVDAAREARSEELQRRESAIRQAITA